VKRFEFPPLLMHKRWLPFYIDEQTMRILIILLLFISCDTRPKTDADDKTPIDLNADLSDFQGFWGQFREAVLTNDTVKIISLTKLPIETRDVLDSDPIIKYGKKDFVKIFSDFLKTPTGTTPDLSERQIDLIIKTEKLDSRTIQYQRIGDMEFGLVDGQWRLVFIYYGDGEI
jgi:hypothetical protein